MNNPTFFRLSSGLYINLSLITCIWLETHKDGKPRDKPVRKFNLAGEPETDYPMTEEEFNQIVDL
jgi:hypothetical protein